MPLYEYHCSHCNYQKEFLQKISDAPLTVCPACQQPTLVKLISAAGFQLKGTGWYVTDFKDKAVKPATQAAKTESKPATDTSVSSTSPSTKKE